MKLDLPDVLIVIGAVGAAASAFWIYQPAGVLVLSVELIVCGLLMTRG